MIRILWIIPRLGQGTAHSYIPEMIDSSDSNKD